MAGLDLTAFVEAGWDETPAERTVVQYAAPGDDSGIWALIEAAVTVVAPLIAASVLRESGDVLVEQKPGLPVMHDVRAWLHENADRIARADS